MNANVKNAGATVPSTHLVETALGPIADWCFGIQQAACRDLCLNVAAGRVWWEQQDMRFASHNLIECLTRMVLVVDSDKGYVLTPAGDLFLKTGKLPPLPGKPDNYHVVFNTNQ